MMLIHTAHSDIPRGSLNMCCRCAEIGPKAPQEAQSNPQNPTSVSLSVTLLTAMYRQMAFCCSLEPLSRWPGCGFCCTSKKWAMGKLSRGHIEVICQTLTFLQQSNCAHPVRRLFASFLRMNCMTQIHPPLLHLEKGVSCFHREHIPAHNNQTYIYNQSPGFAMNLSI